MQLHASTSENLQRRWSGLEHLMLIWDTGRGKRGGDFPLLSKSHFLVPLFLITGSFSQETTLTTTFTYTFSQIAAYQYVFCVPGRPSVQVYVFCPFRKVPETHTHTEARGRQQVLRTELRSSITVFTFFM